MKEIEKILIVLLIFKAYKKTDKIMFYKSFLYI